MDVTENHYPAGWSDDPWLFTSLYATWRLSAMTAAIVMVVTVLITTFLMPRTYRAFAILRPRTETSMQGQLVGSIAAAAIPSLSGLMPSPNQDVAEEYMTLLKSFAFNTALVEQHKLNFEQSHSEWSYPGSETKDPKWQTYRRLQRAFMCDYSPKTGNITLFFLDRDRTRAATVLSYYIDDLRIKLRSQKTHETTAAIDSIRSAATATPDSLLRVNLYELLARQVEQLQLAQVQADFAFAVLEPATAPDLAYSPKVAFDTIAAAFVAFFACSAALMARDLSFRSRIRSSSTEAVAERAPIAPPQ